jgi:hypothetical protein
MSLHPLRSKNCAVHKSLGPTPRLAHNFARDENDWYVEPTWCSQRLFEEEEFDGEILDPACGWGRIVRSALNAGYSAKASDIVIRPSGDSAVDELKREANFRDCDGPAVNIVANPPYRAYPVFAQHALRLARRKVAVIFPVARLNAARWISDAPLRRIWLMQPRPPMPPGSYLEARHKPGGGRVDFCWLVFEHGYSGEAEVRWLHRDKRRAP